MFAEPKLLLAEQCLRTVEYRIVSPAGRKIHLALVEQNLGGVERVGGFLEQLAGFWSHAGTASARTFRRNAVCRLSQSLSETNTRLRLTP